ncbi:MAG: alpha/beta hydrolase [Pricia sp.]
MKRFRTFILLFFWAFVSMGQSISYKQVNNLSYYADTTELTAYQKQRCVLDVYYPQRKKAVPVIIWFHGGGLRQGEKEIPDALKEQGYCIVGVNYRLSPKVSAKKSVSDAVASIAWVMKNIEIYNGDPDKIFVSGHSAGGYLALMGVLEKRSLAAYGLDADAIAGIVPFSGHTITHFTIREEQKIPGEKPRIDEWAPLYHVRGNAPPILLITGDRERELLGRYEENAYFYRMMKENGQKDIDLYEMDGYGHQMTVPAFPLLLKFVEKYAMLAE